MEINPIATQEQNIFMEINPNVTQEEFLFKDFDNDGVLNIDDPYPFDKKRSKAPPFILPNGKSNPYYHKARFAGGAVKLSSALRKVQSLNNQNTPILKKFIKKNPNSYGRVKTVASTVDKLTRRYYPELGDVAGVTIETKKRKQALKKFKQLKKKKNILAGSIDNYYDDPMNGVYYAYHLTLENPPLKKDYPDRKLEVQIKTSKMKQLQSKIHLAYKRGFTGKEKKEFSKKARNLFNLGY